MALEKIIPRETDFAEWYTSIIYAAKLIDYTSIKGMMIFQPNGWAIWQNIVKELDRRLATKQVFNVQLPLLIKQSEFLKEKQHIDGFKPELFLVALQGDKVLEDPYVVRPTSEIAFCNYYKKIVNSYKDLPLKYNQWCNVYRVEKNTKPFLRNCEFFWQELHTVHTSKDDAMVTTKEMIHLYQDFINYFLCIPVLIGEKTIGERFPGAENTFTAEALMQDGQILQCATSHYLGSGFAKIFDIKYQNANNQYDYVHQTSAGLSTRIIGAVIMSHADDKGLVLPLGIAPNQIAILPIMAQKNIKVKELSESVYSQLKNKYRVTIDESDSGFGYKVANQEVLGTPIVIAVGPKDVSDNTITLIRRDDGVKQTIKNNDLLKTIDAQLHEYNVNIYKKAEKRLNASIVEVNNLEDFINVIKDKKIAKAPWGGNAQQEKELQQQTGATPRCIIESVSDKACFFTKKPATHMVYFARAY